ncbi:MBL fold metallo-hydrolase [Plebeiibacterium marinum]|uniref:MBL fold metallo-hydrolase n=1 Tax=Plebeiibacterium marinum TaxID=2992111 RepID=A0AAE3SLK8_9BACT|nr:MBL fold metallo-hydrolase [Plebeiobacterium marinum]MCW3807817.1 MBL fold metallo-hydrolase [Plebeiobacterium marinum]
MTEVCALASGSNGNCYYIGNESEAILIDAGISRRQIVERMNEKGLNPLKIKAVFITHEHSDHYRGAKVLSKKLQIPIYLTTQTHLKSYQTMRPANVVNFEAGDVISIGNFRVHSFKKQHDAIEPCSFRIEHEGKNIGVFTDIGTPCDNVTHHLNKCHLLFLESNYDVDMLEQGNYPYYLKKRVASDIGHLSNDQAKNLIEEHAGDMLKTIYLSHISEDNNRGEIALDTFKPLMDKYIIKLTSRYAACEVEVV